MSPDRAWGQANEGGGDGQTERGRGLDSTMEGLFFFSLSFVLKKKKKKEKSQISHDLEKWPESCVWLRNILWPFPARDVKPLVT